MNDTMMALVYKSNGSLKLEERPIPQIINAHDAVLRVTLSTICTSDLHIKNGAVPRAAPEIVLGHEFVGEIVDVGSAVVQVKPGDRVAANCITFCGECWFCRHGFVNNCVQGGWELGCRMDGCQAEYVRVPFADTGLTKIPDAVSDENALFLGDILSSGYFGAELCELKPGDAVAVLGCGPVGLCAMECARLFGASTVIGIDLDPTRLALAKTRGLADQVIDARTEDVEACVLKLTGGRGADGVIEAAGGRDTFQTAWKIARPNGVAALVAMYEKDQVLPLPAMYGKNLTFKTGGVNAVHCARLMKLIETGRLHTDFLITHRSPLNDILQGYHTFENHLGGCIKWVVTPYLR